MGYHAPVTKARFKMLRYLPELIKQKPKHEITFKMVSGKNEVYSSLNGELKLYNNLEIATFSDGEDLTIINTKNVEGITFSPLS